MTLRFRRLKLLVSAVEVSSAKVPWSKWANVFSRLFHHSEGDSGLPDSMHLTQTYLRGWAQDASVLPCHKSPYKSMCAMLNQLRTLPLSSGALVSCHFPYSTQLPPGPKEVSRSHRHAAQYSRDFHFLPFPHLKVVEWNGKRLHWQC